MPAITLNLNAENAPNPVRKHFEKTNIKQILKLMNSIVKRLLMVLMVKHSGESQESPMT